MLYDNDIDSISNILEVWYEKEKRELPWRNIDDPYRIWVSEIILQQTRVAQGYDYFCRFVRQFPDIKSLADASEDEVLKCWQGLGYYSRARNLHAAAKQIVSRYGGIFPSGYEQIRSLKGVGDYTAAAVASLAFGLPYAVVDGNVYRFLSRFFGIGTPVDSVAGRREFRALADALLDRKRPALYNQAIMEFGALQCVPSAPACQACPLAGSCVALAEKRVASLPVKEKKTKVTGRYFYYFAATDGIRIWLHKRDGRDIWQNLYELPLFESDARLDLEEVFASGFFRSLTSGVSFQIVNVTEEIRHVLSHQKIYARCITLYLETPSELLDKYISVALGDIAKYPVPRLMEIMMKNLSETVNSIEKKSIFTPVTL
jgi:A/G-specific adenine glycosylase